MHKSIKRVTVTFLIVIGICVLIKTPYSFAHLTGAFSTYLASVYNEGTLQQLKDELAQTTEEINKLTPQLEKLEKNLHESRTENGQALLAWLNSGLDLYTTAITSTSSLTDVVGNQWLVQQKLEEQLDALHFLHLDYLEVKYEQQALEGHRTLLQLIEEHLTLREPYLQSLGVDDLETQAYYLDIDWVADVEDELIEALEYDAELIHNNWSDWLSISQLTQQYEFTQQWLNERTKLQYHFRSDHIYAVFNNEDAQVILIAQVLRNEQDEAELVIESGFYNGFFIPELALEELSGFTLQYDAIAQQLNLNQASYIVQGNGKLVLRVE